jgi:hypothetical protein
VSGAGFALGRVLQHLFCCWDWRPRRLYDGVAVAFGQGCPGFAEVELIGFFGGDSQYAEFVDFGLTLAVVFGDLTDLEE